MVGEVLVTGASGFVGKAVCSALLERGDSVLAMARRPLCFSAPRLETWLVEDISAVPASDFDVLSRVDAIVHCAGRAHKLEEDALDSLSEFRRVNSGLTLTLARAAADAGVKRFVFVSSIGVNGTCSSSQPVSCRGSPGPRHPSQHGPSWRPKEDCCRWVGKPQ